MIFDYGHIRAKKSRLMNGIRPFLTLIKILRIIAIISGLTLILLDKPIGWLILAVIVPFIIVLNWWNGELHRLNPDTPFNFESRVASNILGKMPKNITSEKIAEIILESSGGMFIATRFGL